MRLGEMEEAREPQTKPSTPDDMGMRQGIVKAIWDMKLRAEKGDP